MTETTSKAWGGALSGALVSFIPILTAILTGSSPLPDDISALTSALTQLAATVISGLIGYVTVYYAPKNQPLEAEE